jgi:uncharacterized membrane protein
MYTKNTKKITISGMVIALYIVIMYITQSFSFGAYQVRIATALYALAYIYPFLVIPLGIANLLSNLLGGLGLLDMLGGFGVGIIAGLCMVEIRRHHLSLWFVALPIWLVPSLVVPIWLSFLLGLPYVFLVINLLIGQAIPAIAGVALLHVLERAYEPMKGLN